MPWTEPKRWAEQISKTSRSTAISSPVWELTFPFGMRFYYRHGYCQCLTILCVERQLQADKVLHYGRGVIITMLSDLVSIHQVGIAFSELLITNLAVVLSRKVGFRTCRKSVGSIMFAWNSTLSSVRYICMKCEETSCIEPAIPGSQGQASQLLFHCILVAFLFLGELYGYLHALYIYFFNLTKFLLFHLFTDIFYIIF